MYGGHMGKEFTCLQKKIRIDRPYGVQNRHYIIKTCAGATFVGTMYTVCVLECLHRP